MTSSKLSLLRLSRIRNYIFFGSWVFKSFLTHVNVNKGVLWSARIGRDSQNAIRSQEIHHGLKIRNYIIFLDQMMGKSRNSVQTDQCEKVECTNHVLNWLSVEKSRDWLEYRILPIRQVTFSVKYIFSIKCNSSFWSTQNADSKYV